MYFPYCGKIFGKIKSVNWFPDFFSPCTQYSTGTVNMANMATLACTQYSTGTVDLATLLGCTQYSTGTVDLATLLGCTQYSTGTVDLATLTCTELL